VRLARFFFLPLVLVAAFSFGQPHKPLSDAVILIIRHAEKPDDGDGLTHAGELRAKAYIGYFNKFHIEGHPLQLTHVFAATDSDKSHRPRLTIQPYANAFHKNLDLRFSDKDPDAIADELRSHDHGNEILICWRHGKIPGLLKALGADPRSLVPEGKWPEDIYDRVIELHFNAQGEVVQSKCRLIFEHLMPGDEK
jgi:hypothetical protein